MLLLGLSYTKFIIAACPPADAPCQGFDKPPVNYPGNFTGTTGWQFITMIGNNYKYSYHSCKLTMIQITDSAPPHQEVLTCKNPVGSHTSTTIIRSTKAYPYPNCDGNPVLGSIYCTASWPNQLGCGAQPNFNCPGQGGGGGGLPGGKADCPAGSNCFSKWQGADCSNVSCACRVQCGCQSCLQSCSPSGPTPYNNKPCNQVPCAFKSECGCPSCPGERCQEPDGEAVQAPTDSPLYPCPETYLVPNPKPCRLIACAHRDNCSCGGCCDEGGGGPGTPTPTPPPSCELLCPGAPADLVNDPLGGGLIVSDEYKDSGAESPLSPPIVEGDLRFLGLNGFACVTFDDGAGNILPCPESGSGGIVGKTTWTYPIKYHMLCGESDWTYTAVVRDGSNNGADITPIPHPTQSLYPPGCLEQKAIEEEKPTPTLSTDNFGIIGFGSGQILGNEAISCSCSISLGCQTIRQPDPNNELHQGFFDETKIPPEFPPDRCMDTCTFSIDPDMPIFNNQVTITRGEQTPNENLILRFEDGTEPITDLENPVNHTFINAGVYDVKLTCTPDGMISCTRRVNVYCNNGVAPTPEPTNTPTPVPGVWVKTKDADFYRGESFSNTTPVNPDAFDSDDFGDPDCANVEGGSNIACFALNQPGTSAHISSSTLSYRGWNITNENYSMRRLFTPSTYLSYIKARKDHNLLSVSDPVVFNADNTQFVSLFDQITENAITIMQASDLQTPLHVTLDDTITPLILGKIESRATVLVIDGDVTINIDPVFNTDAKPLAIIATGKLEIASETSLIKGIFIAQTADLSYDDANSLIPLKVVGNLVISESTDSISTRRNPNPNQPSLFVVRDIVTMDIPLLPLLSVKTYNWTEQAP